MDVIFVFTFFHKQKGQEGKLFTRHKIDSKFGKLISTIIQKSWPNEGQENDHEEEVVRHLLSWTAAKHVFKLHGMFSIKDIQSTVHLLLGHHPCMAQAPVRIHELKFHVYWLYDF